MITVMFSKYNGYSQVDKGSFKIKVWCLKQNFFCEASGRGAGRKINLLTQGFVYLSTLMWDSKKQKH